MLIVKASQYSAKTLRLLCVALGKLEKLNAYLEITNVSPIKEKTTPLSTSCEKTRKKCVSKALECLTAICSTICPGEGEELETMVLQAKQTLLNEKITTLDQTSFILKEVYLQAESWTLQRQILSIICKDRTFGEIKEVESAVDSITDWKAHIMRSRNQEDARLDLVRDLKNGQVLVTCDWAIKMLPRKYREGQTDWFAKRGMNWHIAVSVFKEQGCIKNFTHVHIFSAQISQDSPITSSLIKDTVADLHTLIPDIQEIHIYSDNAGCYKNTLMMASLRRDVGNKIKSYNFSEAQDGKGPCDRRASHIKSVIKRYINEGHDVTSAEEMKVAIDARQNGQFRVKVVDTVTVIDGEKNNTKSIAGITQLHNFQFESDGLRVWKAYKIGKGQLIPWKSLGSPPKPAELLIKLNWTNEEIVSRSLSTEDEDLHPKPKRRKISYDCPKDGCIRSFSSNETLDNHLLLGDCNYEQVISVHDKAKIMYGTKVNSLFINTQSVSIPSDSVVGESGLRQGWALKTKKKRVIFSDAQRKYMHDRFYAGKRTGSKVDPFRAAEEMRNMKEEDQYLFKRNDYLTGQQISSYFSRLAMKDRNSEPGDFKSAEEEDSKHELKTKILQQIAK
ncbi:Hypothetical predicted protein [Mytilus galloprovincialis]|uniref:C2H2-type domain-containing protein n=1 Tax=Mytilus galloprovincialis TaxID=29158 RepID=A0A8B6D9T5_MYTGA|nr:Hypothetical predicted protein [Mytilus galloprovincialis]